MKKRMFIPQWTIIFTLLFGLTLSTYGSHFTGGEITYRYLSGDTYEVTVRLYRDCDGISFPSSVSVDISPSSGSTNVILNLNSTNEITPICPGVITTCSSSSSVIVGREEWLYQGNVTLPPLAPGQQYTLSHEGCCRNYAITNLNSGGSSSFYISTSLNPNNIPRNNSPEFIELPVVNVCLNQPVNFPVGAFDVDGDELVYSLGDCLEGAGTSVSYVTGLSGTNPLTTSAGVSINSFTGMVSFVPTQIQVAIICVRVEEFRGG